MPRHGIAAVSPEFSSGERQEGTCGMWAKATMIDREVDGGQGKNPFPVLTKLIMALIRLVWPVSVAKQETDSGRTDELGEKRRDSCLFPRSLTGFKNRAKPLKPPGLFP